MTLNAAIATGQHMGVGGEHLIFDPAMTAQT